MGRKPNLERLRQAKELRARGLTYREIGDHLGITHQAARYLVHRKPTRVRCRVCDTEIDSAGALPRDDRKVYCLDCLTTPPAASLGDQLHAFRLAAGLRVQALAEKAGVNQGMISQYEGGSVEGPRWQVVA